MFGKTTPPPVTETKPEHETPVFFEPDPIPAPTPAPPPKSPDKIDTIIGEGTRLIGTLQCKTLLRIDGVIEGDVISEAKVVVSERGLIKGNVTAQSLTLGGELTGNAEIRDKTEILATGKLYGDIVTKTMIIDENGILDGKCTMKGAAEILNKSGLPDVPGVKEILTKSNIS